jgi:hypothetical protein
MGREYSTDGRKMYTQFSSEKNPEGRDLFLGVDGGGGY